MPMISLPKEKMDRSESFSRVIRRLFAERPALTAGELLDVMQEFKGKGVRGHGARPSLLLPQRAVEWGS